VVVRSSEMISKTFFRPALAAGGSAELPGVILPARTEMMTTKANVATLHFMFAA
jgi:hypothetical protein